MRECLFSSVFVADEGAKTVNPKEFIRTVKAMPEGVARDQE
jgi:hypothetical protein